MVTGVVLKVIIGLVLGAVAALAGFSLLYLPNATWGSLSDLIVALLWGLTAEGAGASRLDFLNKLVGKAKTPSVAE